MCQDDVFPLSTSSHSFDSVDVPLTPGIRETHPYGMDAMGDEEFLSLSSSPASTSGRHESESSIHDIKQEPLSGFSSHEDPLKQDISSEAHHLNTSDRDSSQVEEENIFKGGYQDESSSLSHGADVNNNKRRLVNSQRKNHLQRNDFSLQADRDAPQDALVELDVLRQELSSEINKRTEVEKALSLLIAERDSIKEEMEGMKSLERSRLKTQQQSQLDNSRHNVEELEDELTYLKGVNSNLSLQLRKTQESNSELLLEIEDLDKLLREKEVEKKSSETKELMDNRTQELLQIVEKHQKDLEGVEQDKQRLIEENQVLILKVNRLNEELKGRDDMIAHLEDEKQHKERLTEENLSLLSKLNNVSEELKGKDDANAQLENEKQRKENESQEQMLTLVEKYKTVLQDLEKMKEERLDVDREMTRILEERRKEEGKTETRQDRRETRKERPVPSEQ